jgi:hypothetical protein
MTFELISIISADGVTILNNLAAAIAIVIY